MREKLIEINLDVDDLMSGKKHKYVRVDANFVVFDKSGVKDYACHDVDHTWSNDDSFQCNQP